MNMIVITLYQFFKTRKFGLGFGIVIMFANLTISQIVLMIKKPSLPEDQNYQERFGVAAKLGLFGCVLVLLGSAAVYQSNTDDQFEVYLIVNLFFSYLITVGLPACYIVSLPNLKNYTINFFRKNIFDPLFDTLNTINHFVIFRSSRVDPMYEINQNV